MELTPIHESAGNKNGKLCFVTIGATAGFDSLISAVLSETFIEALEAYGYTDLLIQHGKDASNIYRAYQDSVRDGRSTVQNINVRGFAFNAVGLGQEMRMVKGRSKDREGVIISHAGKRQLSRWSYEYYY